MEIYGLQKVTLLDYPGHVACTVFLGGCNFDCPYCHNKGIAKRLTKPVMSDNAFLDWLESRKGKLDGVCISGGEPTVNEGLGVFIDSIKSRGFLVKLDTNGYEPDVLRHLRPDYIAMDIKNSPGKYCVTTGRKVVDLARIQESVNLIMSSGIDYEFRTTVTASLHKEEDFESIGELINGARAYYLQRCTGDSPDQGRLRRYLDVCRHYVPNTRLRG